MSRYSSAWANIARENNVLKLLILFLGVITFGLGISNAKLSGKPALVVERGCVTRTLKVARSEPSGEEVEAFLREAISERFDSVTPNGTDFLSLQTGEDRSNEQTELSRRGIKQRVLFNELTRTGPDLVVDADRILSIAQLRSAYSVKLSVSFEETERTPSNPYGMILTQAKVIETTNAKVGNSHGK
jgi:hypothetical protein